MRLPSAVSLVVLAASPAFAQTLKVETFTLKAPAEVQAIVTARCDGCDWGRRGKEAAVLTVTLDGREKQDLVLARGPERAEYAITIGPAAKGRHHVSITLDREASAPVARDVSVDGVRIVFIPRTAPEYTAVAYAPILYPRPDAQAAFSDLPL